MARTITLERTENREGFTNIYFKDSENPRVEMRFEFHRFFMAEKYLDTKTFTLGKNEPVSNIFEKAGDIDKNLVRGVWLKVPENVSLKDAIEKFTTKGIEFVKIERPERNNPDKKWQYLFNHTSDVLLIDINGERFTEIFRLPERTEEQKLAVREFAEALSPFSQENINLYKERWTQYTAKNLYDEELGRKYHPVIDEGINSMTTSIEYNPDTQLISAEIAQVERPFKKSVLYDKDKTERITIVMDGSHDTRRLEFVQSCHPQKLEGVLANAELTLADHKSADRDAQYPIQRLVGKCMKFDRLLELGECVNGFRPCGEEVSITAEYGSTKYMLDVLKDHDDNTFYRYTLESGFDSVSYDSVYGIEVDLANEKRTHLISDLANVMKKFDGTQMELTPEEWKVYEAERDILLNGERIDHKKIYKELSIPF